MTPADVQALQTARKALTCLYLAVDEHVADDVNQKVEAAFSALLLDVQALEALRDNTKVLFDEMIEDADNHELGATVECAAVAERMRYYARITREWADRLDVLLHGAGQEKKEST